MLKYLVLVPAVLLLLLVTTAQSVMPLWHVVINFTMAYGPVIATNWLGLRGRRIVFGYYVISAIIMVIGAVATTTSEAQLSG